MNLNIFRSTTLILCCACQLTFLPNFTSNDKCLRVTLPDVKLLQKLGSVCNKKTEIMRNQVQYKDVFNVLIQDAMTLFGYPIFIVSN